MIGIPVRRSLLFVPANRPQLFTKALSGEFSGAPSGGADMVCIELEDGVGPDHKHVARDHMLSFFEQAVVQEDIRPELLVRINHPDTDAGKADLDAIASAAPFTAGVMIPKISSAEELHHVESRLTAHGFDGRLFILIETTAGLEQCFDILRATARLEMVLFGGVDMATALRCSPSWEPLLYARQRLVHAAAAAGIDIMDMPYLNIHDEDGLLAEARAAAHIGFTGKAAIHPAQLAAIHQAFTPAEEQISYAEQVVAAYQSSSTGVTVLDGRLVEKPVVDRMQRVLALARAARKQS